MGKSYAQLHALQQFVEAPVCAQGVVERIAAYRERVDIPLFAGRFEPPQRLLFVAQAKVGAGEIYCRDVLPTLGPSNQSLETFRCHGARHRQSSV